MDKVIQHFGKGEVIIPEGSKGDRTYRILAGEVLICKKNGQGKMIPVARLGPEEIFGEMYLFDSSGVRTASVIASTDVKVEVLFGEDILAELRDVSPQLRGMLNAFNSRLKSTTGTYASLFKEKVIVELPDGTMRVIDNR